MKIRSLSFVSSLGLAMAALAPIASHATVIGGIDYPDGASSFADSVVSYNPPPSPDAPDQFNDDPTRALGAPNYVSGGACTAKTQPCSFVSLGNGGSLEVRFTDNYLTGGGTSADDLHIYEVGPSVEAMNVEISKDGSNWISVGEVAGAKAGIDLDSFGFGVNDKFQYVRLTDVYGDNYGIGASAGADVDAIGAISSAPITAAVPEPGTYALLFAGLGVLGWTAKRRKAI
jgi:hypothetical protein